ncbi:MAG: alginate lyase family protein [Alphaproteobacteria bacterium]|nr:alginate lyase family protein [Alphaproteobacteria bacterium]
MRYWHTLRNLKPSQVTARVSLRLSRPVLAPMAEAPALRAAAGAWQPPAARSASLLAPTSFRFLNHSHSLPKRGGWDDPALEKLWRYNLHYFDDLNAVDAASRTAWHRDLIARWIAENPPAMGTAWEPYPTSLRIVNWIKWSLSGNALDAAAQRSLALQARWLSGRLETHLLGNHYFANAKALTFAGLFFEGAEADRWRASGLGIIHRELPEQVLADGGNFERSPMYHDIFLEDVLDLMNAAEDFPGLVPAATLYDWRETAGRMLSWQAAMLHPDGAIALFNDAAQDIAPSPARLVDYAARLGITAQGPDSLVHMADSGYVRLQAGDAVALLDVAPIGPDYLPGHAHADTLSFELSVGKQRVIVNGGTSTYQPGATRARERATHAHSTVELAGRNSSDVWGGFRVGRRASPFDVSVQRKGPAREAAASHNGYGRIIHRRHWSLDDAALTVSDALQGGGSEATARFILHPEVRPEGGPRDWTLNLPDGRRLEARVECGKAVLEDAIYAPEFGKRFATRCLAVTLDDGQGCTRLSWN